MLRWTAPADDTIRVFGKLKKESKQGNGVRGWIVSSTRGVLKDVLVAPACEEVIGLGKLDVKKGETLTFAVGSEGDTNSDSFNWAARIHRLNADGTTTLLTNAKDRLLRQRRLAAEPRKTAVTRVAARAGADDEQ